KADLPQLYYSGEYLSFETTLAIQNNASVNIILEAKGPFSPFLPGKFAHCVAAGKPVLLLGPYYSECRRLLGKDYQFWSEIDDEEEIKRHIKQLYLNWRNNVSKSVEILESLQFYL